MTLVSNPSLGQAVTRNAHLLHILQIVLRRLRIVGSRGWQAGSKTRGFHSLLSPSLTADGTTSAKLSKGIVHHLRRFFGPSPFWVINALWHVITIVISGFCSAFGVRPKRVALVLVLWCLGLWATSLEAHTWKNDSNGNCSISRQLQGRLVHLTRRLIAPH